MKLKPPDNLQLCGYFEAREADWLAPYAMHSCDTRGRVHSEPEHPYRTCYQRDKDRIIHSAAFRRLEYKTQVFITSEGDYFRTRLTHTLEVAQISRTIARSLSLNEDLVEAIALAHDVGHCPFGHSGEKVLYNLMKDQGGFEHNLHGLRVFEILEERYPDFLGLNLSFEVREGISKHRDFYYSQKLNSNGSKNQPTLESQIVDLSDELAYNNHDMDDGLKSGLLDLDGVRELEIWRGKEEEVNKKYPGLSKGELRAVMINALINYQTSDLLQNSFKRIKDSKVGSVEDVRNWSEHLVRYSPPVREKLDEMKKFLNANLYKNRRVLKPTDNACRVLEKLFKYYLHHLEQIPPSPDKDATPERRVCDYIAGMTDRSAFEDFKEIFMPPGKY